MKRQRAIGIVLVLISILIVILAAQGATLEDRDSTVVLFTLPLGMYMIFTRDRFIYSAQRESTEQTPSEP
jgi:hypothetical protein